MVYGLQLLIQMTELSATGRKGNKRGGQHWTRESDRGWEATFIELAHTLLPPRYLCREHP